MSMKNDFQDHFQIIDEEQYKAYKFSFNCLLCKSLIFNPKMCKECSLIFCKECIDNYILENSCCPNKCENYVICEPAIFIKKCLNQIKLKCRLGPEIVLTEAFKHMKTCISSNMDVTCWNRNKKTC